MLTEKEAMLKSMSEPAKKPQAHTPTIGESLDHYGEEYCARAVNSHEELLNILQILETAARRFANRSDTSPDYVLAICQKTKQAIARAEGV